MLTNTTASATTVSLSVKVTPEVSEGLAWNGYFVGAKREELGMVAPWETPSDWVMHVCWCVCTTVTCAALHGYDRRHGSGVLSGQPWPPQNESPPEARRSTSWFLISTEFATSSLVQVFSAPLEVGKMHPSPSQLPKSKTAFLLIRRWKAE